MYRAHFSATLTKRPSSPVVYPQVISIVSDIRNETCFQNLRQDIVSRTMRL